MSTTENGKRTNITRVYYTSAIRVIKQQVNIQLIWLDIRIINIYSGVDFRYFFVYFSLSAIVIYCDGQ